MALALPFAAARAPSTIVLERSLRDPAIVLAGTRGVVGGLLRVVDLHRPRWIRRRGLASGAVVRSAVATVLLIRLSPTGWIGLGFHFSRLRALLGSGRGCFQGGVGAPS